MFRFIKTTSEVILKEIPNILYTNVNYRCEDGVKIINVHFLDLDFYEKGFQFMYYEVPIPMGEDGYLREEFTEYLNKNVKPIFLNKKLLTNISK